MAGAGLEPYNTPRWTALPSQGDIAAVYPRHAALAGISGRAIVKCWGGAQGRLEDCEAFAETPNQEGFGAAALRLTPKFRYGTASPLPPGMRPTIWLPIRFSQNSLHPDTTRMVINSPVWARAPTFDDVARAFPATAKVADAIVILRCQVRPDHTLGPCEKREERPEGQGFADAALSLAGKFYLDPYEPPGRPDALAADIRFHFLAPGGVDFERREVSQPIWLALPDPDKAKALFPTLAAAKGLKSGLGVVDLRRRRRWPPDRLLNPFRRPCQPRIWRGGAEGRGDDADEPLDQRRRPRRWRAADPADPVRHLTGRALGSRPAAQWIITVRGHSPNGFGSVAETPCRRGGRGLSVLPPGLSPGRRRWRRRP